MLPIIVYKESGSLFMFDAAYSEFRLPFSISGRDANTKVMTAITIKYYP